MLRLFTRPTSAARRSRPETLIAAATAAALGLSPAAHAAFTVVGVSFGDPGTVSTPITPTFGCFYHECSRAPDGIVILTRPTHAPAWAPPAGADIEWTTYLSIDGQGPTRRSGAPENGADTFYLTRGVYPPGYLSRNANLVSFTPGTAEPSCDTIEGGMFIPGPMQPSGPAPGGTSGVFIGRFTVMPGAQLQGQLEIVTSLGTVSPVIGGPAVSGLVLRAHLVNQHPGLNCSLFPVQGAPFGPADVLDLWLEEVACPGDCCGNEINAGCDQSSGAFDPIACGQTISATLFADPGGPAPNVDVDWYDFTLLASTDVTITVNSAFPANLELRDASAGCPGVSLGFTGGSGTIALTRCLRPGTYWARVTPAVASGLACPNGNAYTISMTCAAACHCATAGTIASGAWSNPAIWSTGVVPGPADRATINPGHTVGLHDPASPATPRRVAALTVGGTLIPVFPAAAQSRSIRLEVSDLRVLPGGVVRAENATGINSAGWVYIATGPCPTNTIDNQGLIQGGNAGFFGGGSVQIAYTANGYLYNQCTGQILGGAPGGTVAIRTTVVDNIGGLIRAGHGSLGNGGGVTIGCASFLNTHASGACANVGRIFGGNAGAGFGPRFGGDVRITSSGFAANNGPLPFLTPRSEIRGGAAPASFRRGLVVFKGVPTINRGIITGRSVTMCEGAPEHSGGAAAEADIIALSGDSICVSDLIDANAFDAGSIDIAVSPGGTLDLSGLTAATRFRAIEGITIHADHVALPPGVSLDDLMDPAPVVQPGAFRLAVSVGPPPREEVVAAGAPATIPVTITNIGTAGDTYTIRISDTRGWTPDVTLTRTLAPLETFAADAVVSVPMGAGFGAEDAVTVSATSQSNPMVTESVEHLVRTIACPGDANFDGFVSLGDIGAIIARWGQAVPARSTGDADGDGAVGLADVSLVIQSWATTCP